MRPLPLIRSPPRLRAAVILVIGLAAPGAVLEDASDARTREARRPRVTVSSPVDVA